MSDIRIVNLSSHKSPEFQPFTTTGKDWVLNGKDNKNYQYVIDRYKYSPTNATIIDSYSNYIYGKGLTAKYTAENANQFAEILKLISKKDLKKVVKDFSVFHEASVEVIQGRSGNKIAEVNHLPKNKVVPNKVNDEGEITSYWFSYDWDDIRKYPPVEIPAFKKDTKEKKTIFIIKEYNIDEFYFARPSYFSGLNYAELEEEISIYCVNHIKNGLSAGHIINFNDGEADPEVKDKIERNIDKKLAGSANSGKRILSFNSNKENATTVEAIEISDAHQQYQFFTEEARRQLMVAHKVTSPILFGIKDNSGFGNNADEMETAFDELMMNVIQPMQEVILDALMELLSHNGISLELEFLPLRPKAIAEPTITTLTKQHKFNEVSVAEGLIALGEDENLTDWELTECKPVDYEEEDKITQKFSLSTGTANPNRKSIYDNDFYIFRYRYAGNQNPEREFCKNMMNANKIYRREDIEAMGEVEVNPGFGMHPTPNKPYSIWKFKGGGLLSAEYTGGTCKHYWEKLTYKKKGVKVDVKNPLNEVTESRASGTAGIAPHEMSFIKRLFYNENRDEDGKFAPSDSSGGNDTKSEGYNPPNIQTQADGLKVGQKITNDKFTADGGKFNDNLSLALDISDGEKLTSSGTPLSENFIKYSGDLKTLSSIYFEKNGTVYRISDHELPPKGGQTGKRPFMQKHGWVDNDTAIKNGVSTKDLFHQNNVEIIVKKGKIIKIDKNFNY